MRITQTTKYFRGQFSGQILLSTLLVLLIIALTIVTITITVNRNAIQVGANLDYDRNYTAAETKILSIVKQIADAGDSFSAATVNDLLAGEGTCVEDGSNNFGKILICSFIDDEGNRTVIKIYKDNIVSNYNLANEEYFDIILTGATTNEVTISWLGNQPAFDLGVIYNQAGLPSEKHLLINGPAPNAVFTSTDNNDSAVQIDSVEKKLKINLNQLGTPSGAELRILRLKNYNTEKGTSISIFAEDPNGLPAQVIKLIALNYEPNVSQNSSPGVITQIPLSPEVPLNLTYGLNFQSIHSPICGNDVLEGSEECEGPICANSGCKCPLTSQTLKSAHAIFEQIQGSWKSTQVNPQEIDLTMNATDDDHCSYWKGLPGNTYNGGYEDFNTKIWEINICYGKSKYFEWYPTPGNAGPVMDDLLVIYPADQAVTFSYLNGTPTYTIPAQHLIIGPNGGMLNGIITTMQVVGHEGNGYTYGTNGSQMGNINNFTADKGFHTSKFECPISINSFINSGLIKVGDNGTVNLRIEHIPSGCGYVAARLRTTETITRPPNPALNCPA